MNRSTGIIHYIFYILLHLFYKLYLLLLRTWKRINIFSYKKVKLIIFI